MNTGNNLQTNTYVLPTIILAQFCCTSLWFASNAVINNLITTFNINTQALGHVTSAVQFGFILGTLVYAVYMIADRFSPSKVFFLSATLASLCNLGILYDKQTLTTMLLLRGFTGFFLAGIYPVGMKIATDYYKTGLGKSLGFLVGALVLGTAFPHILKDITAQFSWETVILCTSLLAIFGGLLMLILVPNGPFRKGNTILNVSSCFKVFKQPNFRNAAFGYFGHMWELYAFWAFIPVVLHAYVSSNSKIFINIPFWSFCIIASGSLGCVIAGIISKHFGTKKTAITALSASCFCCLISPFVFNMHNASVFILFFMFWGLVVVADSPLFSTLVAQNTTDNLKGSALTIVNCIGFAITILSIQLLNLYTNRIPIQFLFILLAPGPILGLIALLKPIKHNRK